MTLEFLASAAPPRGSVVPNQALKQPGKTPASQRRRKETANGASLKASTGIVGFDQVTGGGLPRGRTTLLTGGPGSGKTVFAVQFLAHGVSSQNEPGIFVAFEESSGRVMANCESFEWGLRKLAPTKLFFIDAQPVGDIVRAGNFDLRGLLAALESKAIAMGAKRVVFDAIDIVLALLPDAADRRAEVYRLHDWLLLQGLTGLITAKAGTERGAAQGQAEFGFMQFMVDCAVLLTHDVDQGVSQRNLRVQKYRGSSFDENESPYVIGERGIEMAYVQGIDSTVPKVATERVTTGVQRIDTMLGGGYYRAASVLISGLPGTAKTTLCGAFAESACKRGERTLFVSFDSDSGELTRNLLSVGIKLAPHVKSGMLRVISARNISGSAEAYWVRIKSLAVEHKTRCLVLDPLSMLSKIGDEPTAHGIVERLINWCKSAGITMVCTSLHDELSSSKALNSRLHISTLADTWIHLNYQMQAGERNRGISVIKSRGTSHSNQVRELILSDSGVSLADIYTASGEVLMGTLRWEKESAERVAREGAEVTRKLKHVRLDAEEAELIVQAKSIEAELIAKRAEMALLERTADSREQAVSRGRTRMRELRGADLTRPPSA